MNLKQEKPILNIFLIFFIGYSILSIWLGIITRSFTTVYGYVNLTINLFQIISILLILLNYKKNIGIYIFFTIRILNILLVLITNTSIQNMITIIVSNICIAIAFYVFYYDKS